MITISVIPINGADTTWDGFDSASVGAHLGDIPWDATTAAFLGTGTVTNIHAIPSPNFIGDTNFLQQGFGGTGFHFATPQDGIAMYLRQATAAPGNAFTFFTNTGPVVLTVHDIDHALGLPDPNLALGSYENIGFQITGLAPFSNMLVTAGAHGLGTFASVGKYDFNVGATPAPEPATWAMLLMGFAVMAFVGAKKARTARTIA